LAANRSLTLLKEITVITFRGPRAIALAISLMALLAPASAGASSSVDPTTLNPPPPDFFNAECERTGEHILCTLAFADDTIIEEPTGIICDGTELLITQDRSVVGKRYYSADGDLLRRHFRETFIGSLTNPDTGNSVPWVAHNTLRHDLGTPGVVQSGITHVTGQQIRISLPDGGAILVDAGRIVVDESTFEIVDWSGPKAFDDYFVRGDADALDPLCDALS
jgi:hypothetical protein